MKGTSTNHVDVFFYLPTLKPYRKIYTSPVFKNVDIKGIRNELNVRLHVRFTLSYDTLHLKKGIKRV